MPTPIKQILSVSSTLVLLVSLVLVSEQGQKSSYKKFITSHQFHPDNRRSLDLENIPKQDRPDLAWEQDFLRTIDPELRRPAPERLNPIRTDLRNYFRNQFKSRAGTQEFPWIERGPNNVGGRTRALMWDPNDIDETKVWAGGVSGGLWYTNDIYDDQEPWINVDDFWANIAITCIASDPNDPNVFYVGTGEVYTGASRGAGIWKSEDGGSSWTQLSSTADYYYVSDIIVRNESSTSVIYAAIDSRYYQGEFQNTAASGLRRSINGGTSWTQVLPNIPGESRNYVASDLELSANNRIWVGTRATNYGLTDRGGARILYSDNGTSWTTAYSTAVTNGRGRVELACAPSNNNVIYGLIENDSEVHEVVKSIDNGANWDNAVPEPNDADTGIGADDFSRGQAWYDLIIAVNPSDADEVYTGGIDLFKTEDAGTNWEQISHWYGGFGEQYVHADQHQIVFKPGSPTDALFGNDGGVFLSTDMDATNPVISARNNNYNVTQFYAGAIHPDEGEDYYLAGTQDNGTQQFSKSGLGDTEEATGGDGAFTFIDQKNPNVQITSYVYNSYRLSTNGGQSFSSFSNDQSSGSFINPADYDNNLGILYSNAGSSAIGRWTGLREGSPVRNDLAISLGGSATALRVSEFTKSSTTLFVGNNAGQLYKITDADGSASSTKIFDNNIASISCIELGASEDEIIVTFFNYGVTSVWYTDDGGSTWESREGDLPDMPVRWALFNPNNRDEVILATELGVWLTEDFSSTNPTWVSSNVGLANVRVDMLQIRESDHEVAAFTHGRGMFTSFGFSEVSNKKANFSASSTAIENGGSVTFSDLSLGNPVSWDWAFENGTPSTSTDQHPTVTYSGSNGSNDVSLTVTYNNGVENTKTSEDMIQVVPTADLPNAAPYSYSLWDDIIPVYNSQVPNSDISLQGPNTSISDTDDVYCSVMIGNVGDFNIEEAFSINIYLDDSFLTSIARNYSVGSPFQPGYITWNYNISVGTLSAGIHSLRMEIDENGTFAESDDSDNSYTRYFHVEDASDPAIIWDGTDWSNTVGPTTNTNDNIVFLADYIFQNDDPGPNVGEQIAVGDVTLVGDVRLVIDESISFQSHGSLESSGEIIVKEGGSLLSYGDFTNNGDVLVESGASFLLSGGSNFSGNDIVIQRDTRYPDGKYSFVGSPMMQDASITGTLLGSNVFKYDETVSYGSNDGLGKWISASSDQLVPGKGYTQANQKRLTFIGQPNQGPVTYSGTYTSDDGLHEGFNLVANPYATTVEVSDFLTENTNIAGAIYIWDDNGSDIARGTNADYIVANGIATTNTTPAGGESRYNLFLGSGQGFFVKLLNSSDLDIDFTEAMQSGGRNYDDNFFRDSEIPLLRINLTNESGLFKQTILGLLQDANLEMEDRRYDAPAFNPSSNLGIYSMKAGAVLSIQGIPFEWNNIPLQVNIENAGSFSLTIENEAFTKDVFLYDKTLELVHDFNTGDYSFTSIAGGILTDRFELLSSPILSAELQNKNDLIFAINKTLFIRSSIDIDKQYEIINLNGQKVKSFEVNGTSQVDLSRLESGVYLVSDGAAIFKIILK